MSLSLRGLLTQAVNALFPAVIPDPALDLIQAQRITTDFYPVIQGANARCERYYAEKQSNGLLTLKFQSCAGGGLVSNAMADSVKNTPPFPRNLTLAEAVAALRQYDEARKNEVGPARYKAPADDIHYTAALAIANAAKPAAPGPG